MRKKELWDYENKKKHKASGRSLGSHLLHALLISGCLTASATIVISLFFYFYPSEATRTALAVQGFARQLAGARESEEKPPFMSIHQKKKGYEKDDQNTICLPRQHLHVKP